MSVENLNVTLKTTGGSVMVERSPLEREVVSSIHSRVIEEWQSIYILS